MRIMEEHRECAVARCSLKLKVRSAHCGSVSAKCMAHVMGAAMEVGSFERLLPGFLDIDATKGCFAGKDEWFLGIANFMQALQFLNNGFAESNAAWMAVFGLFDKCQLVFEVDMLPFQIEQFALACSRCKREQDDAIKIGRFALFRSDEMRREISSSVKTRSRPGPSLSFLRRRAGFSLIQFRFCAA